jgi:hypothetical protein
MALNTILFNRINNIVDPNNHVTQSKILIYLILEGFLEDGRKIDPYIFQGILKISFNGLFL